MDNDGERIGSYFQNKGYDITRVKPLQGTQDTLEKHNELGIARDKIENLVAQVVPSNKKFLLL